MLPELCFCPACGEPKARRHFSDVYSCDACNLAGEITGWTRQGTNLYAKLTGGSRK